jgi:hypothetical protein
MHKDKGSIDDGMRIHWESRDPREDAEGAWMDVDPVDVADDAGISVREGDALLDVGLTGGRSIEEEIAELTARAMQMMGNLDKDEVRARAELWTKTVHAVERGKNAYDMAAAMVAAMATADAHAERSGAPPPVFSVGAMLLSEQLAALSLPQARTFRRRFFDASEPPFARFELAQAWLERESNKPLDMTPWQAGFQRAQDELQTLADAGSPLRYEIGAGWRPICWRRDEDSEFKALDSRPSEKLRALAEVQKKLADMTGWQEWEATRFILLGVPAAVPRFEFVQRFRHSGAWLQLNLYDPHLSDADCRALIRDLKATGFLRQPPKDLDKLRRLYRFVVERRPNDPEAPRNPRGRMSWARVLAEWNKTYPDRRDHFGSQPAIERAYSRAREFFELRRA